MVKDSWNAPTACRVVSVALAMLLAVTMLPAAGLASAFADEPVERPATSGGDVALQSTNGAAADEATEAAPSVAEQREDGMLVADGLVYTVADGGLALVGFEGETDEGSLVVPASVVADGKETPIVAMNVAEGHVAEAVSVLSPPQAVANIDTTSLAAAFPNLASVEIASISSSLPVAAGAASVRAAYSTSGGMIFRPTTVTFQGEDGSIESIECKELVWAPPALVSARIPVECRAIAEGAFAGVRDLKTVVAFGTMERIADGAFTTEQMEAAKVVVPASSPAVVDEGTERVSASMALMGDAGQKERRSAWHEAGWRTDDIVMGKPYGSLTETMAVTEEGALERDELQLVSYPGAHENAMDIKKPNAEGVVEQAESGLAFTVKSDMTAIVTWQGDKTATPSHLDIPASVVIDNVTYPVTEIAPRAFEGAVFLTSVSIPEGVTTIGQDAFKDCPNLAEPTMPSTLKETHDVAFSGAIVMSQEGAGNVPLSSLASADTAASHVDTGGFDSVTPYFSSNHALTLHVYPASVGSLGVFSQWNVTTSVNSVGSWTITASAGSDKVVWEGYITEGTARYYAINSAGQTVGSILLTAPGGWSLGSTSVNQTTGGVADAFSRGHIGTLTLVRAEAMNTAKLLTESSAKSLYQPKGSYLTSSSAEVTGKADKSYVGSSANDSTPGTIADNAKKALTKLADIESSFGTISYAGLDGSDLSVFPTSYRKGGTPAIPEPKQAGRKFAGWSWSRGNASGDSSDIANAFAEAGTVTLTANWSEPETNHFFGPDAYDAAADGTRSHTIKVKIADKSTSSTAPTVTGVSLAPKADAPVRANATDKISFGVGATDAADAFATAWGATDQSSDITLADLGDGWGLYVRVTVPAGALDEGSIVKSYTSGDYVASLVTLNYTLKSA